MKKQSGTASTVNEHTALLSQLSYHSVMGDHQPRESDTLGNHLTYDGLTETQLPPNAPPIITEIDEGSELTDGSRDHSDNDLDHMLSELRDIPDPPATSPDQAQQDLDHQTIHLQTAATEAIAPYLPRLTIDTETITVDEVKSLPNLLYWPLFSANFLYTNKLPLFQATLWPIFFYTLLTIDLVQYYQHPEKRYGESTLELFDGTTNNNHYLTSTLLGTHYIIALLFGLPLLLLLWGQVTQRMRRTRIDASDNEIEAALQEDISGLFHIYIRSRRCFETLWLELLLPKQSLPRTQAQITIDQLFHLIHHFPIDAKNKEIFTESEPFDLEYHYFGSLIDIRNAIITGEAHHFCPGVVKKNALTLRALLLNTMQMHFRLLKIYARKPSHSAQRRADLSWLIALESRYLKMITNGAARSSMLSTFAEYGRFRAFESWKSWSLPVFLLGEAMMIYASLRYWMTAVNYCRWSIQYWVDQAHCHDQKLTWVYIPERGEYACTHCGDWAVIPYPQSNAWESCYNGLMMTGSVNANPDAFTNNLLQMSSSYRGNAINLSTTDWSAWPTEKITSVFYALDKINHNQLSALDLSQPVTSESNLPNYSSLGQHLPILLANRTSPSLMLSNLNVEPKALAYSLSLFNLTALETFNPSGNQLTNQTYIFEGQLQALRSLTLANTLITPSDLTSIFTSLSSGSFTSLSLSNNPLTKEHLDRLIALPVSTTHLDLSDLNLRNVDLTGLNTFLVSRTLRSLNLSNTQLSYTELQQLETGLSANHLMALDLSDCQLNLQSALLLRTVLMTATNLESLNVSGNNLDTDSMSYIISGLGNTIQKLDLSNNALDNSFLLNWQLMKAPIPSQSLSLSDNNFTPTGVYFLTQMMIHHQIEYLDLSNNLGLMDDSIKYLSDYWLSLPNCTLTSLNIKRIGLGPQGLSYLWQTLNQNNQTQVSTLDLSDNPIGAKIANIILEQGWIPSLRSLTANSLHWAGDVITQQFFLTLRDASVTHLSVANNPRLGAGIDSLPNALISSIPQPDSLFKTHTNPTQQKALASVTLMTELQYINLQNTGMDTDTARALTRVADVTGLLPAQLRLENNPNIDPMQVNVQTFWRSSARSLQPPMFYLYLYHATHDLPSFCAKSMRQILDGLRSSIKSFVQSRQRVILTPLSGQTKLTLLDVPETVVANPKDHLTLDGFSSSDTVFVQDAPVLSSRVGDLCTDRGPDAMIDFHGGSLTIKDTHCADLEGRVFINEPERYRAEVLNQLLNSHASTFGVWQCMTFLIASMLAWRHECLGAISNRLSEETRQSIQDTLNGTHHSLIRFVGQLITLALRLHSSRTNVLTHDTMFLYRTYYQQTHASPSECYQAKVNLFWNAIPVIATFATLTMAYVDPTMALGLAMLSPLFANAKQIVEKTSTSYQQHGVFSSINQCIEEVAFSVPGGAFIRSHFK